METGIKRSSRSPKVKQVGNNIAKMHTSVMPGAGLLTTLLLLMLVLSACLLKLKKTPYICKVLSKTWRLYMLSDCHCGTAG